MTLKDKLFNFFVFHLKSSKQDWDKYIMINDKLNLFDIYITNPFRTWWKARKYFKIPKTKIKFFYKREQIAFPDILINVNGKFLSLSIQDLDWKDKWNSPRFEYSPHIFFSLFNRFGFCIYPEINGIGEFGEKVNRNLEYWEYLLNYVCYNKGLKLHSCWLTYSKIFQETIKDKKESYRVPIYTHLFSLNKKGLKEFKKLYESRSSL